MQLRQVLGEPTKYEDWLEVQRRLLSHQARDKVIWDTLRMMHDEA